jgi:hypothetical protein
VRVLGADPVVPAVDPGALAPGFVPDDTGFFVFEAMVLLFC